MTDKATTPEEVTVGEATQPEQKSALKEYVKQEWDQEILLSAQDMDIILQSVSKIVVFNLAQPLLQKLSLQAMKAYKK